LFFTKGGMVMLRHVVIFKFKKEAAETDKAEVEKDLRALPGIISEIKGFELGRDIVHSERSYDLGLVSAFENLDAMQKYQVHPAHQAVVVKLKKICASLLAVDFEV
jgi:hypothetical protein